MTNKPTAHFVYGPVAAGKSTFALALGKERSAVRFTVDDWMNALFSADKPTPMSLDWALTRVTRCQDVMWSVATQILDAGGDVVLELGLLRERDRQRASARAEAAGHTATFHFVDADRATRAQRVETRNLDRGPTFSFEVTPGMFEAMEGYFEPPTPDESDHVRVTGGRHHG